MKTYFYNLGYSIGITFSVMLGLVIVGFVIHGLKALWHWDWSLIPFDVITWDIVRKFIIWVLIIGFLFSFAPYLETEDDDYYY